MNSATGGVAPWEPSRSATPPVVMHVMVGSGFWVLGSGFWVLGSGFWVLGSGFWVRCLCR